MVRSSCHRLTDIFLEKHLRSIFVLRSGTKVQVLARRCRLTSAVQLANQMGPGVVSQSFGSAEGGWTSSFDATFSVANMTYLAATGDAGAEVDWPAVSSHVLAVSGTSLTYSGTGSRTETVWSGTGGGVSAYVPKPTYQALAVPGINASGYRGVSDVTFNADPNTGQYLAARRASVGTAPVARAWPRPSGRASSPSPMPCGLRIPSLRSAPLKRHSMVWRRNQRAMRVTFWT
jgi:hypothetical protein